MSGVVITDAHVGQTRGAADASGHAAVSGQPPLPKVKPPKIQSAKPKTRLANSPRRNPKSRSRVLNRRCFRSPDALNSGSISLSGRSSMSHFLRPTLESRSALRNLKISDLCEWQFESKRLIAASSHFSWPKEFDKRLDKADPRSPDKAYEVDLPSEATQAPIATFRPWTNLVQDRVDEFARFAKGDAAG